MHDAAQPVVRRIIARLCAISAACAPVWGCGAFAPAPDLSGLAVAQTYDEVAGLTREQCRHLADQGVRAQVWTYGDGSSIEVGIYDGLLSGLRASPGRARQYASTIRNPEISADSLMSLFGDRFNTIDDVSDRECYWRWRDGRLMAVFSRGLLVEAVWLPADGSRGRFLVQVTDEVALLLVRLGGKHEANRYRALVALESVEDARIADALVELLRVETSKTNRGLAALILARIGDLRANELLLPDLDEAVVNVDVLRALGQIGDVRVEQALRDALPRQGSYRIQAEIQNARASIRRRLRMPSPDRR